MTTPLVPQEIDERGIPVFDKALLPLVVEDGDDWRGRLDAIREQCPFFRFTDDPQIWVSRYESARQVFSNGDLFAEGGAGFTVLAGAWSDPEGDRRAAARAGDARHREVRRALLPHYAPAYVRTWESRMREVMRELLDRLGDRRECDFVLDVAQYFFPYIGAQWLGAPREDWDQLVKWEHDIFLVPPDTTLDRMLHMDGEAMTALMGYLHQLLERARQRPRDDSFSSFVAGLEQDGVLSSDEAMGSLVIQALGSGHTVTATLSYLFHFLATHPDERKAIVADREKILPAAEEVLRVRSLFGHARQVTEEVELDGCPFQPGDQVFVMYTMPNRDPRYFGEDLDLGRSPNQHLAFNFGTHQCLGMHWARQSWQVVIEEWHARYPEYQLKPGAALLEQVYAGVGYHSLPLVW